MKNKTSPRVSLKVDQILMERALSPDDVVKLCHDAGEEITRTTIYNAMHPHAKGIHLRTLTALCAGLRVKPADLFRLE